MRTNNSNEHLSNISQNKDKGSKSQLEILSEYLSDKFDTKILIQSSISLPWQEKMPKELTPRNVSDDLLLFGLDIGTIIPKWPKFQKTIHFFRWELWIDIRVWQRDRVSQLTISLTNLKCFNYGLDD